MINMNSNKTNSRSKALAFTLVEISFVSAIFLLVIVGLITVQIVCMQAYALSESKLLAADSSEKALDQIRDQIRESQLLLIGNYSGTINLTAAFPCIGSGTNQVGNALLTSNSSGCVIYYLDASTNQLKAYDGTNSKVLAYNVTNANVFDAEAVNGSVLTNYQSNRAIGVLLQFSEWKYSPTAGVRRQATYQARTLATER